MSARCHITRGVTDVDNLLSCDTFPTFEYGCDTGFFYRPFRRTGLHLFEKLGETEAVERDAGGVRALTRDHRDPNAFLL